MDGSAYCFTFPWNLAAAPADARETNQYRREKLPFDDPIVVGYLRNIFARAQLRETISRVLR